MEAKGFATVLIEADFPKDKCVVPNAPKGGAAAAASATGPVTKHLELRKKRITKGAA
jgi:hypothetical protein